MNEETLTVFIRAVFSAVFLIASEDGEISPQEMETFIDVLKERHDLEIEPEDVEASFQEAFDVDEEEHLSRISEAAGLPLSIRQEILNIALLVGEADGEVSLSEIVSLPDVVRALDIELPDLELDEAPEFEVDEHDDDGSAQSGEEFEVSLRKAEASLRAEGNDDPSSADILLRAASDLMSGLSSDLNASLVQREGFAAYQAGDHDKARSLYLRAAEAGDADAMFNLGQMYMAGEGVDVDWGEAVAWWVRAGEKGHLNAQRNAWKTLAFGQSGVVADEAKAIAIAALAAAQGDEESTRFVREKTLSSLQASALVAASLMAGADGNVSDEEVVAFGDAWKQILGVDYSAAELRDLFAENARSHDGEEKVLERLSNLGSHLPFGLRQRIMQTSMLVALSDKDFRPEEQAMVEKLAAALDVDLSDLGGGLGLKRDQDDGNSQHPSKIGKEHFDPDVNPVLVAALHGDFDRVRSLLSRGHPAADVHASGTDALIIAVREGHQDIVELLLDAGADPNRMNPKSGMTPLRMAVQERKTKIAEHLLKKGANPDLCEEASGKGALAVLALVASAFEDGEALHLLDLFTAAGAKQREILIDGQKLSLIGFAAWCANQPAGFLSRLAEGATRDDLDLALWYACIEGQTENACELVAAGANVNMVVPHLDQDPTAAGDSPINAAATRGHAECVRVLIDAGADVNRNVPPEGGQFPLLMASENGHLDIVSMLLEAGADASMINPENSTHPLGSAVRSGHSEIVSLLLRAGADPNSVTEGYGGPLIAFAANDGYIDIVRSLIDYGADVNASGVEHGNTALILASNQGHAEIIELLLRQGADPGKVNPVNNSDALLAATIGRNAQCVKLLLEAGASPNRVYSGNAGDVPLLIFASDKGNAEIVRLLVTHGADLNATDGDGLTALQRAGIHRHKDVEAALIELGADPERRLVKFTDTPVGQQFQNEILADLANRLDAAVEAFPDTEAVTLAGKKEPKAESRGFLARLFGRGRRP